MVRKKTSSPVKKQKTHASTKRSRKTHVSQSKKHSRTFLHRESEKVLERMMSREGVSAARAPRPKERRRIGSAMHPYMRTMFLSLAVGSAGVFASMLYYIHVAHATENSLYHDTASRLTAEAALSSVDDSFTDLIHDLEAQRKDAGGALPIPPREYLRLRAEQSDVDYALLNRIAFCESHWRMVENKKSSAEGYFQILDGTEQLTPQYRQGLRKTDPYVNIDMAIFLYKKYGTIPWVESQECWSN